MRWCLMRSVVSSWRTRAPLPSPISTMPGRPMARCTRSWLRVNATAGLTSQPRFIICKAPAAAPGWPSICLYAALSARRPSNTMTASRPAIMPNTHARTMPSVLVLNSSSSAVAATPPTSRNQSSRRSPRFASFCFVIRYAWKIWRTRPFGTSGAAFDMSASLGAGRCHGAGAGFLRLLEEPPGTVGRANERAGHDAGEADVVCLVLQFDELLRLHPALDGMVPRARAQVLGDGDEIAPRLVEVEQCVRDLVAGFAHAEDEVAL